MKRRAIPDDLLRELAREHGTPLYVYDATTVLRRLADLSEFDVVRYAQKANSNLALLRTLSDAGVAVDAVSAGEVERALAAGFQADRIVYTSDLFDRAGLETVARHGLHANLGSADMIEQLAAVRPGTDVTLRVNPGFGGGHDRKVSTGGAASKHGIWHTDLSDAYQRARRAGLTVTGLHAHVGSGADVTTLERAVDALGGLLAEAPETVRTVSAGGGLSVPYRPDDSPFDVARYSRIWTEARARWQDELGREVAIEVEPGRYLVAEAGVLLCEVRALKSTGEYDWTLVDAGFHTLVRPTMYGAYHHVSIVGRDGESTTPTVVAGPLCESADVFTQDKEGRPDPRPLPRAEIGDLVCVHDTGAYGASMASNYNSMPLPAEVLVEGGRARVVRRRQTLAGMLADETEG